MYDLDRTHRMLAKGLDFRMVTKDTRRLAKLLVSLNYGEFRKVRVSWFKSDVFFVAR